MSEPLTPRDEALADLARILEARGISRTDPHVNQIVHRVIRTIEAEARAEREAPPVDPTLTREALDRLVLSGALDDVHAGCVRVIGERLAALGSGEAPPPAGKP